MRAEGWYHDPYGIHGDRWFSDGQPTNLVRDQGTESRDEPPPRAPSLPLVPARVEESDDHDLLRADEAENRGATDRMWTLVWPIFGLPNDQPGR